MPKFAAIFFATRVFELKNYVSSNPIRQTGLKSIYALRAK